MNPQLLLFIIKLILGGLVSFLSIMIMSKTREVYWMMLVIGFLTSYAALLYDIIVELGLFATPKLCLLGIPVPTLIFAIVPSFFFILAFFFRLLKK